LASDHRKEPAPPTRRKWWLAALLVGFSLLLRLACLTRLEGWHVDEWQYALPTAQRLAAGELLVYIHSTNYGAPIHEAVAAVFFRIFGESLLALRLPNVLFSSLSVGVSFLLLRRIAPERVAFGIGLLLAAASSAVMHYGTAAHPVYAVFSGEIVALQALTWWLDQRRTLTRWLLFGLAAGFATYSLQLAVFQTAVSLLWLYLRSDHAQRLFVRIREESRPRRRLFLALAFSGTAALLAAPLLYVFLTRRADFILTRGHAIGWGMVALLALVAFGFATAFLRAPTRHWIALIGSGLLFVAVTQAPLLYYRTVELPRLLAAQTEVLPQKSYTLKHAHEWPRQLQLYLDGVFPALFLGQYNTLRTEPPSGPPHWPRAIFSLLLLGVLTSGAMLRVRSGWRPQLSSPAFVVIAPFFIVSAVLFPSWALFFDMAYRYLIPFLPGFYLLAWHCLKPWLSPRPRTTIALLTLTVAYSIADSWLHLR
jgi:hypothetical protein